MDAARTTLLLALLAASPVALAQPSVEPAPAAESFDEVISVEVVNVEVRVTDRQGRPLRGLTREDFRLFEDGDPVEIEYFSVFEGPATGPEEEPAAEAPPTGGEPPEDRSAAREPLRMVLFLDQAHMHPSNRARVIPGLEQFIDETLQPEDQVMVVDHDRRLRLRRPFTTDRSEILAGIREVAEAGTFNLHGLSARRDALRELAEGVGGCDEVELLDALSHLRGYASWLQSEAERSLAAVRTLIGTLRGLPGQTVLVYVSDGMEQQPAGDLFEELETACPLGSLRAAIAGEGHNWNLTPALERLAAYSNTHRVTLYPFDSAGLRADGDSELGGTSSLRAQRMRTASMQGSLFFLGDETGGKAILNANRIAPELARVVDDAATFYSLGFTPDHQGDGRVHRIRVEMRDRPAGVHQVRYRKQYLDVPPGDRVVERMTATLLHGAEDNPLGIEIDFGLPRREGDAGSADLYRVPIRVRVPLASLVLVPEGGATSARVVLYLATLDAGGNWNPVRQKEVGLERILGEGEDDAFESFLLAVDLSPGEAKVAVGVHDALGGSTSYLREELQVSASAAPAGGR